MCYLLLLSHHTISVYYCYCMLYLDVLEIGVGIKRLQIHQNCVKNVLVGFLHEGEQGKFHINSPYKISLGMCMWPLTTVGTAPGFCTRRALTTWNTSTTPSVLHLSMVVAMAQNIPLRVTVSLQWTTMGLLPDLIWTLVISSITSVTLFRLEQ